MPGAKERELRRRIGSVQSTKKITRAMELIAATRVVKAMQRANEAKPYSTQITDVIENLVAAGARVDHPLMRQEEQPRRVGIIAITSDRGLAGAYNASVIRAAEHQLNVARNEDADYSLILIGKKAIDYFTFRNFRIDAKYTDMSDTPRYEDAREVANHIVEQFSSGELDRVELVYTEFITMGTQRVTNRRYLPLATTETMAAAGSGSKSALAEFEYEPSPGGVIESLLPRYMESRLYSALLESAASEHASRQRAMKAATDNAEDLITKLSREMNQARQASITTEIMEIVSGAEALGGDETERMIETILEHTEGTTV
jgi:F-type H+-transporting ATPase subunit gamma